MYCITSLWREKNDFLLYWVVRKIRAAKDLNLINEIKNLNLLRFNFPSKSARTFRTTQYYVFVQKIKKW